MIDGNVIKFGYGDLVIQKDRLGINIQQVKKAGECGNNAYPEEVVFCGPWVKIPLTKEEYDEFMFLLDEAESGRLRVFSFKKWTFDFSNFNEESIKVCRENVSYNGMSLDMDALCMSLLAC